MDRDDIRRWAKQACGTQWSIFKDFDDFMPELEQFAELVAAAARESIKAQGWRQCAVGQRTTQFCGQLEKAVEAEREACARICEIQDDDYVEPECAWSKCAACAREIRARSQRTHES